MVHPPGAPLVPYPSPPFRAFTTAFLPSAPLLQTSKYEPVLACVVSFAKAEGCSLRSAAQKVEERRQSCGDFDKLLALPEVSRFAGRDGAGQRGLLVAELRKADPASLAPPVAVAPPPAAEPEEEACVSSSLFHFPSHPTAASRVLGLDPACSTGFSLVQSDDQGRILSASVGTLCLPEASHKDGARLLALSELLSSVLSPAPDKVVLESFFGHSHQGDALSFKIRGVIELELCKRGIEYEEVAPQSWKAAVLGGGSGGAAKTEIRARLEGRLGHSFPTHVCVRSVSACKWSQNAAKIQDAVDATGIALFGALSARSLELAGRWQLCRALYDRRSSASSIRFHRC